MDARRGVEIHRARDAAVPPLVLVLHERRVGPLDDPKRDLVRACLNEWRHVELGGQMRVLADSDLMPVDGGDQHALRGSHVKARPGACEPGGGHVEVAFVNPVGVVSGSSSMRPENGIWTLV